MFFVARAAGKKAKWGKALKRKIFPSSSGESWQQSESIWTAHFEFGKGGHDATERPPPRRGHEKKLEEEMCVRGARERRTKRKVAAKRSGAAERRERERERTISKTWKRSKGLICLGYGERLHCFTMKHAPAGARMRMRDVLTWQRWKKTRSGPNRPRIDQRSEKTRPYNRNRV